MLKRTLILILCAALPATALAGGYGGRHHFGGHFHHHRHGGDAGVLLAGLVIGGLAGYLISEDRHYRRRSYPAYRHDYHRRHYKPYYRSDYYDYGYRRPAYRAYVPVRPAPRRVVVRKEPGFAGNECRMTREYTTTIEVDGQPREAYGTRCLTADGSWVLGRPRLAPEFE